MHRSKAIDATNGQPGTAESWLAMQDAHDHWIARREVNLDRVTVLDFAS